MYIVGGKSKQNYKTQKKGNDKKKNMYKGKPMPGGGGGGSYSTNVHKGEALT